MVSVDDVNYCHMLNVCALAASFTPQLFILDINKNIHLSDNNASPPSMRMPTLL